jgi:hypothetical protein
VVVGEGGMGWGLLAWGLGITHTLTLHTMGWMQDRVVCFACAETPLPACKPVFMAVTMAAHETAQQAALLAALQAALV